MKVEKKIVLIYSLLGIVLAFATNYFSQLGNIFLALALPLAVYSFSLPLLFLSLKGKKFLIFYNSLITFFLIWFIFWIFFYNLS
ncbi:MAG: hypothetical protein QW451_01085 [Candidatus Aenigmatarchaeota archaeon]